MPGLKTHKRIKKDNTASPVMMMSTEPSVFRPRAHTDPSSESHSKPKRINNPALQLKRAQKFGFKFNTSLVQRNTEGTGESSGGTGATASPHVASDRGDRSNVPGIAAKVVKKIADSKGIQSDDELGNTPHPNELKNAGTEVKSDLERFNSHPHLATLARQTLVDDAQNSGETLPSLTPKSQGGGTSLGGGMPPQNTMTEEAANAITTRDRRTAVDYDLVSHEASHKTEAWNDSKDTMSSIRNIAATATPTGLSQVSGWAGASTQTQSTMAAIGSVVFSALDSILNARSALKTRSKIKSLEQIIQDVKGQGYDDVMVDAVHYAIKQKYKKIIARSIALVGNLTTFSASTAVLATGGVIALLSNPVGWSVLTGIAAAGALIGAAVALWYIGRWIWKKRKGTLGIMRRKMAMLLLQNLNSGDPGKQGLAQQTILVLMGNQKGQAFIDASRVTGGELQVKAMRLDNDAEQQPDESAGGFQKMRSWWKRRKIKKLKANADILAMSKRDKCNFAIQELESKNDSFKRKLKKIRQQHSNRNGASAGGASTKLVSRLVRNIDRNNTKIEALKKKRDASTPYVLNRGGFEQGWNDLSKLDRNRIKQIERKLKSW